MIDTIVLRLHNLEKYTDLVHEMDLKRKQNRGYKTITAILDTNEIKRLEDIGYRDKQEIVELLHLTGTGQFLYRTQVHHQVNRSHHYAFTYWINYTNNFIEFNFSIPKYLYGTNILMFIDHAHTMDNYFVFSTNSTIEHNIERSAILFRSFIKGLFLREFINSKIDFLDLEVNRIDVCFNQLFKTKQDARRYFDYQRKLKKKHSREGNDGKLDYETSFMYKTDRYSAKIYHKGTEYKKHDLKEHLKINKEKGFQYFDTMKLQQFADRMLRYELTIRNAQLTYLFKHNIFRKDCPFWQINYKNYLRVDNIMQRNDRIAKKIGSLPDNEKEIYKKLNPYERITKDDKETHKYVSRLMQQSTYFMLKIDPAADAYNRESVTYSANTSLFSAPLLRLCLKKLLSFINEFQIQELPNEERLSLLIDEYNRSHKKKIQKTDIIQFYHLLVKYGSFDETAKYSGYSRATLYRYKKRLKLLGITEKNIQPDNSISLPSAAIDFREYHTELIYNNPLK